ncbi:MAG: ABC transporter permease [Roseiflexaceae bacterium]|nr:ABC transporter permease [Roseiflexaceae bacterium]
MAATEQSAGRRLATLLYRQPRLTLALLLVPPLLYLLVLYLGSLASLLLQSFFALDDFSGLIVRQFTLRTYANLFSPANLDIIARTTTMALAVTIADALLAFPLAYYMARYATPRTKAALSLAVVMPLWASYLVRVYAWKLLLAKEGIIGWVFTHLGIGWLLDGILALPVIGGPSLSVSLIGTFLTFMYVWLPYMILPIQAALERVPPSLIEASADLGAHDNQTFRHVILPLALPGVVAGSIFTFSLTLGDFIIPGIVGNSSRFIGMAVLEQQGTSGNIPLAAAFTMVPILIMAVYLLTAKRLGAFDAL